MGKRLVEIEVTIALGGETTIEGKGFKGSECLKETASLEEALGKVGGRNLKPEASQKATSTEKLKAGQ